MDILKEMQEVIKKSLPQHAAGQLKTYIEEQEKKNKELTDLEKSYSKLIERLNAYEAKDSEYNALKNREKVVENEEYALSQERQKFEEERRELKVERLEYQLQEAKKRSDDSFKILDTLVRNPRSTEFWSSNKNVPIQNKYADGSTYDTFHNINETITKDVEEHK